MGLCTCVGCVPLDRSLHIQTSPLAHEVLQKTHRISSCSCWRCTIKACCLCESELTVFSRAHNLSAVCESRIQVVSRTHSVLGGSHSWGACLLSWPIWPPVPLMFTKQRSLHWREHACFNARLSIALGGPSLGRCRHRTDLLTQWSCRHVNSKHLELRRDANGTASTANLPEAERLPVVAAKASGVWEPAANPRRNVPERTDRGRGKKKGQR